MIQRYNSATVHINQPGMENIKFFEATPYGKLELGVVNSKCGRSLRLEANIILTPPQLVVLILLKLNHELNRFGIDIFERRHPRAAPGADVKL